MKLDQLFENDHGVALKQTGFWGRAGAGCIFLARDTGRILLAHRSEDVEQPHTWGCWGGAIDSGEDPVAAVRREVAEEAGYHGDYELDPLYVFKSESFRYYNFLVIVEHEFVPILDWENQGYEWCEWGHWPTPLHFGLVALFGDPPSSRKIQAEIGEIRAVNDAGVSESVGAVLSANVVHSRPEMMTGAQRQEIQYSAHVWAKEHPRATSVEIEMACPYDRTQLAHRRIWIMAATSQA